MSTFPRTPAAEPQIVRIRVDRGYRPAQSVAQANVPLRLVFQRRDADHCTERVIFSSPHIERRLVANGTTAVDLPAQPPGVVRFTCGMGRYRGEVALVEHRAVRLARASILRLLGAGASILVLLAAAGMLRGELVVGLAAPFVVAIAALSFAPRLTRIRPFNRS